MNRHLRANVRIEAVDQDEFDALIVIPAQKLLGYLQNLTRYIYLSHGQYTDLGCQCNCCFGNLTRKSRENNSVDNESSLVTARSSSSIMKMAEFVLETGLVGTGTGRIMTKMRVDSPFLLGNDTIA